jgi:hypothetical protein
VTVPGRSIRAWGVFTVVLKEVILQSGKCSSRSLVACALFLSLSLTFESAGQAQTPVLTAQFNNARTAANLTESVLNLSNVNSSTFGKVLTFNVDGQVYAQPLYVPKLMVNGALHNVLYVATMANTIFAFDADTGEQLHALNPGQAVPAVPENGTPPCPDQTTTGTELGILSTPVIDLASNSLYLVSAAPGNSGTYTHRIYALDITTLGIKSGPVTIAPSVPGNGSDSTGGQVVMNQTRYLQRPGLLLSNGNVYAGFGSCGPDPQPYHGWVVSFATTTLRQTGAFNTTPNGYQGAIWQSGRGLVGDTNGNVYSMVGNGSFDGVTEFSDTFLKLSPALRVLDWFLPPNRAQLEEYDLDPSSAGPILTPDTNLLVGGGKDGIVYVLNPSNLGHQGAAQSFHGTHACDNATSDGCYQIHSTAYLSGTSTPMFYVWGFNDILRSYKWIGGAFQNGPLNNTGTSYPGAMLAVSSLAGAPETTSILWAVERPDAGRPGIVHAFDALNVSTELWNSAQNSDRDALGEFSKFGQPVIADGKVFVPTFSNTVVAYGLLPTPTPPGNPLPPPPPPSSDVTGPNITCSANPSTLWPPNGKSVPVTISGGMSDPGSGLNVSTAHYSVWDEYGQVQTNGPLNVSADGSYSVGLSLISSRNGNDSDGRQYTVSITVKDTSGNRGSCVASVQVPHNKNQ